MAARPARPALLQAQLAALDGQYQQKIIAELERYQELVREREALNRRWVGPGG